MQLIVTHQTVDFDAFAAAVAAARLYAADGRCAIVLDATEGRDLHAYLNLHRDRFEVLHARDVNPDEVTRVVVVDVRRKARLQYLGPTLERMVRGEVEVHVYDHHRASADDLVGDLAVVEPVGSATTLLVERLDRAGIELDEVEATLMALGIHTDTLSLTAGTTTPRDAAAVTTLLGWGVRLDVLNRYLRRAFAPGQRRALSMLLDEGIERTWIRGLEVGIGCVALDEEADGLAEVASELLQLERVEVLVVAFASPKERVLVVGRSSTDLLDLGEAFRAIGGGGHAGAATARSKGRPAEAVLSELREAIANCTRAAARVGERMSSPVNTVSPDLPLRHLDGVLQRWRCRGAPVVKDGRLVGIVTRRDVAKMARREALDEVPVAGVMGQHLITTTPDAPLREALLRMTEENVGRLPVLQGDRLVGIITRHDVLRSLYPEEKPPPDDA